MLYVFVEYVSHMNITQHQPVHYLQTSTVYDGYNYVHCISKVKQCLLHMSMDDNVFETIAGLSTTYQQVDINSFNNYDKGQMIIIHEKNMMHIRRVTPPVIHPEDPTEDVPTMHMRGKKQRKDCRIQDRAVEGSLVEFFRENEMLWNSQKTEYRNKAKRQRILQTKATELEIGVDHLWTWFKSLRDMFTRQVFMFEIMKMLEIIAMTSIVMEIIYLPYTYHIVYHILIYLPIYLPYAYNTYQVGQEEEWGGANNS